MIKTKGTGKRPILETTLKDKKELITVLKTAKVLERMRWSSQKEEGHALQLQQK